MSIVIASLIAYFWLSWPWNLVLVLGAVVLEGLEMMLWLRWRNVRSVTGEDALIGAKGRAVTPCRPDGQVMVRGQLWTAHSVDGVDEGDPVKVVAIEGGIKVLVAPAG